MFLYTTANRTPFSVPSLEVACYAKDQGSTLLALETQLWKVRQLIDSNVKLISYPDLFLGNVAGSA